jgi:hypothetical protein
MVSNTQSEGEENSFVEFRRKVWAAEMLSSAMERLLRQLQFTGGSASWCKTAAC